MDFKSSSDDMTDVNGREFSQELTHVFLGISSRYSSSRVGTLSFEIRVEKLGDRTTGLLWIVLSYKMILVWVDLEKKSKVHSNPMIPHEHHLALPENALSQDPLVDSHLCITLAITGGTRCTHVYPIFRHIILGLSLFFASHPNSRRLKKRVL